MRRLAVHIRQNVLHVFAGQVALGVTVAVVVQPVDVLHGGQQRAVLDHVTGVLGKHVIHVPHLQRVAGVGGQGLGAAHVLDLAGHVRALLGVLGGALLRRLDGPVFPLREFLIAVHGHAGIVAPLGKVAAGDFLETLRHLPLRLGQRTSDGSQIVHRQADVLRAPLNGRLLAVFLDGRLHHAAHCQVMHRLFAAPHQIVEVHDLPRGQHQPLAVLAHEELMALQPPFVDLLVHELLRRCLNGFQHGVLLVLRVAQRPVYLHARLAVGVEERIRVIEIQRQLAVGPLPGERAVPQCFRQLLHPGIALNGQILVEGGHALFNGPHRLPHGGQFLAVHVGDPLVAARHHLIQQPRALAAQQVGVDHQRLAAPENFVIGVFQGNSRLCPLGGVAVGVMYQLSVFAVAVCALLIDAAQQRRHALPQLFNGLGPEFLGTAVRVNLNIRNVLFQMRIIVGSFPQLDALRA